MNRTISFHLQKGGVGKTTISGAIACESALKGVKTLLIDVDPQGNTSSWFLHDAPKYELSDVLQGKCFWSDAVVPIEQVKDLFLIPTFAIGGTLKNYSETRLAEEPFVLQDLMKEIGSEFPHIVLDLSPGFGRLEKSALIASNEVITPMTPEVFSLDGLEIFIEELKKIRKNLHSNVLHSKIIINSYDGRIKQHKQIFNAASKGNFDVFRIPVDSLFRKAQEASAAPQLFRDNGKGLKNRTASALCKINTKIWS